MFALSAGDTAKTLQILEEFGPEPVKRCRAVTAERRGDSLVVIERQRCLSGDPPLDRVRDLGPGLGVALALESLRKQTGTGAPRCTPATRMAATLPD